MDTKKPGGHVARRRGRRKEKDQKSGGHKATKAGPKKKTKKTGHVSLNLNMM